MNVRFKALATLIRCFLETAAIPQYRHSLLHSSLYRYYILEDKSISNPGDFPYYPIEFFQTIKRIKETKTIDILSMSIGQWTKILTEDGLKPKLLLVSMFSIQCWAEIAAPTID